METRMSWEIVECARVNGLYDPHMKWCRASDVEALRAAVAGLMEAGIEVLKWEEILNFMDLTDLRKAIAAVERLEG